MESMDNKPSPPTAEDPHDVPRTARKRKSTLRARDNAKKGNRGTPWTTNGPTTPAEPPSDHDHDDDDGNDEEDTLIKERQRDAPIDAPSSRSTSHSSSLAAATDKSVKLEPQSSSQSSSPPSIARSNNDHRRRRRNLFERALDAGLALCAISTVLALVLLLDAYEYVIVPKASKPRLPSEASAPASRAAADAPAVTPTSPSASETDDTSSFRHDTKLAEIHARSQSDENNYALVPSREALPAETQPQQPQDVLPKEERAIARTVETKTDVDPFCPECAWLQTSITCAERFRFVQKRYHADADDVVKKSLLDQGCRRNDEARSPTRDESHEAVEKNAIDEEDAARASDSEAEGRATEHIAREEAGIDLFCPECTWQTTSITCAARFKYIQERYHNDEDDVVKKSLLGQGCKRESGARKSLLRGRR